MSAPNASLKRFWVALNGSVRLERAGYLIDPEGATGRILNPDLVTPAEKAGVRCIVLLGEPGSGKSTELLALHDHSETGGGSGRELYFDLRQYGSEERLHRALFCGEALSSWRDSVEDLTIYLDSLDECLIHIKTLAAMLVDELKRHPLSRLKLRIACRTAQWPMLLRTEFRRLWGEEDYAEYELAPLRKVDVLEAARRASVDPLQFVSKLQEYDIVTLAVHPLSLNFLLRRFAANGHLPKTRAEAYFTGCRLLAAEANPSRLASLPAVDLEARMAIIERIAALTLFSRKTQVLVSDDPHVDVNDEDLTLSEVCIGTASVNGKTVSLRSDVVRDAISSSLFTARGPERFGWSHWSYAEFLAARFAVNHFGEEQQKSLLFGRESSGLPRVLPALGETAAWMAAQSPSVFQHILSIDPTSLLRSSMATADSDARHSIVEAFLRRLDEELTVDRATETAWQLGYVGHPGLAAQILPYIQESSHSELARTTAIRIAEESKVHDVSAALLELALNSRETQSHRIAAIHALSEVGSDSQKTSLIPLTSLPEPEDPDDEIKGAALRALWPRFIDSARLFQILTVPRRQHYLGLYRLFIHGDLAPHLAEADLPMALRWLAPKNYEFRSFEEDLLAKAGQHLNNEVVLSAFADFLIARLEHHDGVDTAALDIPATLRRKLQLTILNRVPPPRRSTIAFGIRSAGLVRPDDFEVLLADALQQDGGAKDIRLVLAQCALNSENSNHIDALLIAREHDPAVRQFFNFLDPVDVDSQWAMRMREARREESVRTEPPPIRQVVDSKLSSLEQGEAAAWWQLNLEMTRRPGRDGYGDEFEFDLTKLSSWTELDNDLHERFCRGALRYLDIADPHTSSWIGGDTFYRPAAAGLRALRLLQLYQPSLLDRLSPELWEKWAAVLVTFPESHGDEGLRPLRELIRRGCARAPDAIVAAVETTIDQEAAKHDHVFVTARLGNEWHPALLAMVLRKVEFDGALHPQVVGELLWAALPNGKLPRETGVRLIQTWRRDERSTKIAVEAAATLIRGGPGPFWDVISDELSQSESLFRQAFTRIGNLRDWSATTAFFEQIGEEAAASLYLHLRSVFPSDTGAGRAGETHARSMQEGVVRFSERLLSSLAERGSEESVRAIQRICTAYPTSKGLFQLAKEAERIRLQRTWKATSPRALLKLADDADSRIVDSAEDLLEVVLESLRRFQLSLYAETPTVRDLWNEEPRCQPKDESALSDRIKRHLDADLGRQRIVVNREVEIRSDQKTDIHIDAFGSSSRERLSVTIEVKGCWNKELKAGLKSQLFDRYLRQKPHVAGIYLVGWFRCPQWSDDDYRKARCPTWDVPKARGFFERQAAELDPSKSRLRSFLLEAAIG